MAKITVTKDRYTAESLYQWDVGQVVKIYGLSLARVPEIHFKNSAMDGAIVKQATMSKTGIITVSVPNSLLQKPCRITAYVCIWENGTFSTEYKVEIPVIARAKPNDYTLEADDDEIYSFNELENTVKNMLVVLEEYSGEFEKYYNKTVADTQCIADEAKANKHAENHFSGGSDPITPESIGAETKNANLTEFVNGILRTLGGINIGFNKYETGSYEGTGAVGSAVPNTLTFDFTPKIVIVSGGNYTAVYVNPFTTCAGFFTTGTMNHTVTWGTNSVSWYGNRYAVIGGSSGEIETARYQLNESGETYHYVAIG